MTTSLLPEAEPEPPVRGQALFRAAEAGFLWLERGARRLLPDALNPLLHTGAIATTLLLIAIATGGLLLFWYSPSVHHAYPSMLQIEAAWAPRLIRSLHRYSSDACVLFVALHALRLTAARRFTGARWLAWVTGLAATALLWLVGWTGYWLVWDERARQVAVGSARVLDRLPVFADRLEAAFLTDAGVHTLLFFIVFFVHMLIPLGIAVALWLHLARLQRAEFLPKRGPAIALTAALVALSLAVPATVAGPARMAVFPKGFTIDAWYLLPLWLTDRAGGGTVWALLLAGTAGLLAVPWLLARGKSRPATIITERCNACEHCVQDCPYEAISLVPRTDGKPYTLQAQVDPDRCLGCGICNASCATAGSGLPHFDTLAQRSVAEQWVEASPGQSVAFVCHDAVPAELGPDALPGYRVMKVPCAGWLHAITVERLLRKGAPRVLIAGCAGNCRFREGMQWAEQRMAGTHPTPLDARADRSRVTVVAADRLSLRALRAAARPRTRAPIAVGALATSTVLCAVVALGAEVPYAVPRPTEARLAVSFKHPGAVAEKCRTLSAEEQAAQPVHMRRAQECARARQSVTLALSVDGQRLLQRVYPPSGLWDDGSSVALEELDVPPGRHTVAVELHDGAERFVDARALEFVAAERRTLRFDRTAGFTWD